jgi:outer membrane lipoprotein-sorting protein
MSKTIIEQKEQKSSKKIALIILLILLLLALLGFFFKKEKPEKQVTETNIETDLFSADRKHGNFLFQSGVSDPQKGEFWFDGNQYRLTWYLDNGDARLHMINPEGEQLYYARPDEEATEIAYVSPLMHFSIFNGPEEYLSKEDYQEDDFQVSHYLIDKLWEIEGASQSFYLKDLTVYEQNDLIKKVITRTNSRKVGDDELVTSSYEFSNVEYPTEIDQKLFELPYPVKDQL